MDDPDLSSDEQIEAEKRRCTKVRDRIERLRIPDPCTRTLIRLVDSELRFLSRLSLSPNISSQICVNTGYLETVVRILEQPFISGVSRVCKPVPLPRSSASKSVIHVDIVCTLNKSPVWFIVSDRNPKCVSWLGFRKQRGLRARVEEVLSAARSAGTLRPDSVFFFFNSGIAEPVSQGLVAEFGALDVSTDFSLLGLDVSEDPDGDWVHVHSLMGLHTQVFQLNVDCVGDGASRSDFGVAGMVSGISGDGVVSVPGDAFSSLILAMRPAIPEASVCEGEMINFDTTALVALVSGISNGGTERLLKMSELELASRFKSNSKFVMDQVESELQRPMLMELRHVLAGKSGIICETVNSEFKELVKMCGGPSEKLRANSLLRHLRLVPDQPSARMMGLPNTRKVALKNKIIFGTGDHRRAPTLTANMGFVRAISQTGMSLLTIEHRPRALTGD
ncbi:hypothetical protein QJS10_CPB11g02367 [Acorus calamus]|uniref:DUF1308 domain-containing protein n=1 Tax=Acorus calamus TaxID=4465 RepID=A0AAV9DSL4_ACOCL|nr:hypothetical protein QJS10_CPB11g02367 [Acorus calamus]